MTTTKTETQAINVSIGERWLSIFGGGALAALAFRQRGIMGVLLGLAGWYMTHRGITGHCAVYDNLELNTAVKTNPRNVSVPHEQGVHVVKSTVINRMPEELYSFWRNFENLPRFMTHLESVKVLDTDGKHSHWIAKGPAGTRVEWDAEIINEVRNEVIAWRSIGNAQVANAGSVRFRPVNQGQSTEIEVTMEYVPPAGQVGVAIAKLLGEEPEIQVREDLKRFKQLAEAGKITAAASGWQGVDNTPFPGDSKKNSKSMTDTEYPRAADQAEGERNNEPSSKVGKTPGQAEG